MVSPIVNFGAVGDGFTDDTLAIQAALDAPGDVLLEACAGYRITSPLYWRKPKAIIGQGGRQSPFLIDQAFVPAGMPVLTIQPPVISILPDFSDNYYWTLRNLYIRSRDPNHAATPCGHAINIDLGVSGRTLGQFRMYDCNIQQVGRFASGIYSNALFLNNGPWGAPTNIDGLYTSIFQGNNFVGGIDFTNGGDSLTIFDNTFWDNRNLSGTKNIAIRYSAVAGAANVAIERNNFYTQAGSVQIDSCNRLRIVGNQMEYQGNGVYAGTPVIASTDGQPRSANVFLGCHQYNPTNPVKNVYIADNNINTAGKATHCILMKVTSNVVVVRNNLRSPSVPGNPLAWYINGAGVWGPGTGYTDQTGMINNNDCQGA